MNLRRLIHKPFITFSVVLLLFFGVLAMIGPLLISDKSKNTNTQIPQLAYASPGHKTIIVTVLSEASGQEFDKIPVTEIVERKEKSLTVIEDLPEKYRYEGWDTPKTLHYSEAIVTKTEEKKYLLGMDGYGRSLLERIIMGLRISLFVGIISIIMSGFLGILMGALSALGPRWLDQIIMFFINSLWSIPTIILVFVVLLMVGSGINNVIVSLILTLWIEIARLVRGEIKKMKEKPFVQNASLSGMSTIRLFMRHILPNIWSPVIVMLTANFALAILLESGLSFLGFGVKPPSPSLGNILSENYAMAITGDLYAAIFPVLTILLLVFSFNIIGNALRDRLDVKMN